jgi:glucosamine--fructose-6-phosphate aminotransferase (isomerizing)
LLELEYRGYDSCGLAVRSDEQTQTPGGLTVLKDVGKVAEVSARLGFGRLDGSVAIGHTRWATHGGVTKLNSHPHTDCFGGVAVVHNGIIENYGQLRAGLSTRGHKFASQTDSEIIPHLIEELLASGLDLKEAVAQTANKLEGRFAFLAVCNKTAAIAGAKVGSPLVLGFGQGLFMVASDPTALSQRCTQIAFIEDGQLIYVTPEGAQVSEFATGDRVALKPIELDARATGATGKDGYPHYLLKEIMEQKHTIRQAASHTDEEIMAFANLLRGAYGTYFVGCGSAGKIALESTYLFSEIARMHVNYAIGSEFPLYKDFVTPKSLLVAISQSGETADTLESIETIRKAGGRVASIVNVAGSTIARKSDLCLTVNAGPEKAVCSTKALTGQLAIVTLLAYACAGRLSEGRELIARTSKQVEQELTPQFCANVEGLAKIVTNFQSVYVIGRGLNYPAALESAIKLQEVAYIHAEGFAAGELKHGPLALIQKGTPVIALVSNDRAGRETLSNAMEVKARGGFVIGISPFNDEAFDFWLQVPDAGIASPIVNLIPIHLLAYYIGVARLQGATKSTWCATWLNQ